jgi:hypothetical protein
MIGELQKNKVICFQALGVVATNATSATTVDTSGWEYARIDVLHNVASATNASAKWTALKLQHGTTTDATNHTNIVGAVGTTNSTATSSQFVLGVHNDTAVGGVTSFFVNCAKYEKILRIEKQAAASYHSTANIITLSRGASMPDTAAELGASAFCVV